MVVSGGECPCLTRGCDYHKTANLLGCGPATGGRVAAKQTLIMGQVGVCGARPLRLTVLEVLVLGKRDSETRQEAPARQEGGATRVGEIREACVDVYVLTPKTHEEPVAPHSKTSDPR